MTSCLVGALLGCESPKSNGGPKIRVTPDAPLTVAPTPDASVAAEPPGEGIAEYPAKTTKPPPAAPPVGKGLSVEFQRYIVVDQFGYRPEMTKIAILVDPVNGWNGNDAYSPGEQMEVRTWKDGTKVFEGPVTLWDKGRVDPVSGDRGYWFNFSKLTQPGLYYVYDPKNHSRSHPFEIDAAVFRSPLVAATKMFYFNRANFEKKPPYSCVGKRCWSLGADYVGPQQDTQARSIESPDNPATARDLHGGWWDAGDTNKYVTFAGDAVHTLLTAYNEHPAPFTDNFGIPESGNGIPDLLDELKWELDWLTRMQPADLKGGMLIKVGNSKHGDPIPDRSTFPRFYYPKPCSSATIVGAGMFAHAALVYRGVPSLKEYADGLSRGAAAAYRHYMTNPKSDSCDNQKIKSGDADQPVAKQEQNAVVAAIYLFALTDDKQYDKYIQDNFENLQPFKDDRWSIYDPSQGDALLFYAGLPNANPAVKEKILSTKRKRALYVGFYRVNDDADLYRAFMRPGSYHWGSNRQRATHGSVAYDVAQYKILPTDKLAPYVERAAAMLHSFHGVNPMQLVYLTNMYGLGGDECADELFHTWFRDGDPKWDNARTSELGPAPGYLTGGPNLQYCKYANARDACKGSPVRKQPPGKAYLNSNTGWDPKSQFDKSWELTEPGIYYQAAYVRLVSKFVD